MGFYGRETDSPVFVHWNKTPVNASLTQISNQEQCPNRQIANKRVSLRASLGLRPGQNLFSLALKLATTALLVTLLHGVEGC